MLNSSFDKLGEIFMFIILFARLVLDYRCHSRIPELDGNIRSIGTLFTNNGIKL
jgi:hypothetical protein